MLQKGLLEPIKRRYATYVYQNEISAIKPYYIFTAGLSQLNLRLLIVTNINHYEFEKNVIATAVLQYGVASSAAKFDRNHYG